MFLTSILSIIYFFSFFSLRMFFSLAEKKLTWKANFGYTALIVIGLFLIMTIARYFDIKFFSDVFFYSTIVIIYSLLFSLILKPITMISKSSPTINLSILFGLLALFFIVGIYNSYQMTVKKVEFTSPKITKEYNFVLLSDTHIGSNSPKFFHKIMERVCELKPDAVFITGDFIDERYITIEDIRVIEDAHCPFYFITGNHEVYADKHNDFFHGLKNFHKFEVDSTVEEFNNEINIIGFPWGNMRMNNQGYYEKLMKNSVINSSKYNILLNHEPSAVEMISENKIDLMLSGHTHNGQMFPFKYMVKLRYEYIYGSYRVNDMDLYVTSGTATWGPKIRLGTQNEIIQIILKPE
ncbi:MAG: metallophosphoesterase [Candidatus Delongbacteria bacterium]|nr:metallophosphoesterase [Candidatus Delongbacteria bacterium]